MDILVILAHPDESSFNHAIAEQACETLKANGHTPIFHDLYKEDFDPRLPGQEIARNVELPAEIAKHCDEIANADGIIIVHPNWWGMPPALLKGWIDRVIRPGIAYEFIEGDSGEGVPSGLLKADKALVFNTSNTEKEREQKAFGDPLERIWKDCIFDLCGVPEFHRSMFGVVVTSSQEERQQWLREVKEKVDEYFPADS
ncbi:MAG: NAD(P)H-dependent oxidoreductase [Pseudodesulfovibrio sp.]